jgi:hypothetical protein
MLRYMVDQNMKGKHVNSVAIGDPHIISMQTMENDKEGVRDYIARLLSEYRDRDSIFLPYNTGYVITK